jgi:mannose-6-phosphate isomerase-like protein (cupin superfamily)
MAFNLWQWIEEYRQAFEPPVGNKVIWEDSQFTAMIIRGPNARRDFHIDPSDEIFYMLKGDMILEYMQDGTRQTQVIREGDLLLVPALTPHSPHRPPDTWGLVVVIVQWVVRSGDAGRQAIALFLKFFRLPSNSPMRGALQSGAISPATPPYCWYTRGALPIETPP